MQERSNVKAAIAYDDLREWLSIAERLGEVRNISGASWQEDIGLAAEAVLRAEAGPCVVFDDIPGCPKGFRVLLNMFAGMPVLHRVAREEFELYAASFHVASP